MTTATRVVYLDAMQVAIRDQQVVRKKAVYVAIGVTLDGIEEWHELLLADEDVEIASGTVAAGTISGMRFEIRGMIARVPHLIEVKDTEESK